MNRLFFLFVQWFKRDLSGRFCGTWLGLLWPLVQPAAILSQPNLVTKVRYPLLLLPAVTVGLALVHVGIGAAVLVFASALTGTLTLQMAWLPLWLIPVLLYGTALAFILASLGVFVRDIGQAMPALTSLMMFLTPIFYPMSAMPPNLQGLFELNPVGWAAESLRGLLLEARALDLTAWGLHLLVSTLAALIAFWIFRQLEEGFADVL